MERNHEAKRVQRASSRAIAASCLGRRPHAKQQIFERVVLDEVELDVFIALAFAGCGIGLAEQIQFRAAVGLGGLRGGRVRDCGQIPGLIGVCGECLVCRGLVGLLSTGCGGLDK